MLLRISTTSGLASPAGSTGARFVEIPLAPLVVPAAARAPGSTAKRLRELLRRRRPRGEAPVVRPDGRRGPEPRHHARGVHREDAHDRRPQRRRRQPRHPGPARSRPVSPSMPPSALAGRGPRCRRGSGSTRSRWPPAWRTRVARACCAPGPSSGCLGRLSVAHRGSKVSKREDLPRLAEFLAR